MTKFAALEPGSVLKDYDIQRVQSLEENVNHMDSFSINCWLIQEVLNKTGGRYPSRTLHGIVCGLHRPYFYRTQT